ncbi:FAD-dependent oxidoreductase [Georgenia sp. AZ-5]|uniref:FAD-dependent oxidoreductase n=1 Tax=Georgenia sp. AZ-5 TaxID=3367526 RepID=UPI003754C769
MSRPSTPGTPERVVVVGYGPVAARLVDELLPAVREGRLELLVLGQEDAPAYNRVLVADVGVGRTTADAIGLSDPAELAAEGVQVMTGTRAVAVDRVSRQVVLADGRTARYDRLVLATGARAAVPPLAGLDPGAGRLPAGVTALRDLHDAARLLAAVRDRRELVVLGGGVLGLEAALAAAEEGARVTLVHTGTRPMARNLDHGGGTVLAAALRAHGVRIVAGAVATGVDTAPGPDRLPWFRALVLDDGTEVPGDQLLLSCGVRPRVELARTCALPVGKGVLVDHRLQADREGRVFAIGDCAEVLCGQPGCRECAGREGRGPSGLIGPGWRQAEWLAARLSAGTADGAGDLEPERPSVVLLKARALDLAAAGHVSPEPWDIDDADGRAPLRVAQWADPEHGRYAKMVTRDGVLEGLVCVGMPRTAAELVLLYERGAELPADRTSLFRLDADGEVAVAPAGPESMVCRCTGATLGRIDEAVMAGCATVAEVGKVTRAGTGCGGCHDSIRERLARAADRPAAAIGAPAP